MKEYHLKPNIELVNGATRSALYDLNTRLVYSINRDASEVLQSYRTDDDFWQTLILMDLATSDDSEENCTGNKEIRVNSKLNFAWLELTTKCNENCLHCYGLFGKPKDNHNNLTYLEWREIITQLASVGCDAIQFIGGEPFMYRGNTKDENVITLAKFALETGIKNVEIFTNGTYLTERRVGELKHLGVKIAVSIYSSNPTVHEQVTQTPGSFRLTLNGIERLIAQGISTRAGFIIMSTNQDTLEDTMQFLKNHKVKTRQPDIVRPSGGGTDTFLQPNFEVLKQFGLVMKPNFMVSKQQFEQNQIGNPCLFGKIAITTDGNIIPCIFARDQQLGNVRENSLDEILNGERLQSVWKNTKDLVLVCQDCEYRYGCHDCRPLASGSNRGNNFNNAPAARCTYNPYTGQWGEGLWRLDSDNNPIYLPIEER